VCTWLKLVTKQEVQSLRFIDDSLGICAHQEGDFNLYAGIFEAFAHVHGHRRRLFPSLLNQFCPFVLITGIVSLSSAPLLSTYLRDRFLEVANSHC
jgi:hypothetical protein